MRMVKEMECKKCGTIIDNPGVSFCPNCRAYINKDDFNKDNKSNKNHPVTYLKLIILFFLLIALPNYNKL